MKDESVLREAADEGIDGKVVHTLRWQSYGTLIDPIHNKVHDALHGTDIYTIPLSCADARFGLLGSESLAQCVSGFPELQGCGSWGGRNGLQGFHSAR
jgi:hypothetical protein